MNSNTLLEHLQTSFRMTLGATASLVEMLQDPSKRDANLSRLRQEWGRLSEEWAEKGEVTEQEARNFVDSVLKRSTGDRPSPAPPDPASSPATSDVQQELQDLTAKVTELRAELEQLRKQDS